MKKEKDNNSVKKEAISMATNASVKMDTNFFDNFLKMNKSKIDSIVPQNPSISKDDEWRNEDFWDEHNEGEISK